ncbi:hypothetical protein ACIQJ8_32835 [Streptomyces globisporus]|uniref:hypothetical protein n=1 Tax=Streptomyces globisporus TaxID=1908 RepID=UPI0037FE4D1F
MDIDFSFHEPVSVLTLLGHLHSASFALSIEGKVSHLVDLDGMFEWSKAPAADLKSVVSELNRAEWSDRTVGITLLFPGSVHGGDLLFHPCRTKVSLVIEVNRRNLPESQFCDFGWYLNQIIPILEPMGLVGVEAQDSP